MDIEKEVREKEAKMRTAHENLVGRFNDYKIEFDKLALICESYDLQCATMNAKIDVIEPMLRDTKALVLKEDWDAVKKLYSGVNI